MRAPHPLVIVSIVFVCAVGVRLTATPANRIALGGQELAPGAGKAIILDTCASSCHGTERFASEHRSKSQWIDTIETMKGEGASASEADFKAILGYLVAHSGIQIKINSATAKQIDDAMDLEPGQSDAIVKYRDEHGKFADWQALMKVPGLDPKKLEEQKANVIYE
jgi:competence ComEA-like helix-hairpin-helix protein